MSYVIKVVMVVGITGVFTLAHSAESNNNGSLVPPWAMVEFGPLPGAMDHSFSIPCHSIDSDDSLENSILSAFNLNLAPVEAQVPVPGQAEIDLWKNAIGENLYAFHEQCWGTIRWAVSEEIRNGRNVKRQTVLREEGIYVVMCNMRAKNGGDQLPLSRHTINVLGLFMQHQARELKNKDLVVNLWQNYASAVRIDLKAIAQVTDKLVNPAALPVAMVAPVSRLDEDVALPPVRQSTRLRDRLQAAQARDAQVVLPSIAPSARSDASVAN